MAPHRQTALAIRAARLDAFGRALNGKFNGEPTRSTHRTYGFEYVRLHGSNNMVEQANVKCVRALMRSLPPKMSETVVNFKLALTMGRSGASADEMLSLFSLYVLLMVFPI